MTQAVATDKSGFNATTDDVSSSNMTTFADSVDTLLNNILNGVQAFDIMLFQSAATLQITTGVVDAPTQVINYLAAETGTTDSVDTIGIGNNRFIVLKADTGDTITLNHGTGNIVAIDGNDVSLSGNAAAMLWCIGNVYAVIGAVGVRNNQSATTDPGSGDDSGDSYSAGSQWINTSNDRAYINVDNTLTTSIWKRITPWKNSFRLRAAAATVNAMGIATPTIANSPASANDSSNILITLPTTASSGNIGGFVTTTFNLVRVDHDPVFETLVKTDATITTQRLWVGLTTADQTNSDTAAGSFIGFRWSTVAGEAGWIPVLRDGTTQSTGTAIGTVAASTTYKLRVRVDSGNARAYFSVNDGAEQTFGTNFPTITNEVGLFVRCITTSAAIRLLNFSYMEVGWG